MIRTLAFLIALMTTELSAADWSAWVPANHAGLRWEGRVRFDAEGTANYDWTQVRLHARFTGPRLAVNAQTNDNYLDVIVDGKTKAVLGRKPKVDDAPLLKLLVKARHSGGKVFVIDGLGQGEHSLIIAKRTSANIGVVSLQGLRLAKGHKLLSPPPAKPRRIEFIGDSLTNGYGNEALKKECAELPPYENSSRGWARKVSDALGAEAQLLAFSGFGVVRNYGDKNSTSPDPYPIFYPRTVLAEKDSLWDREQFKPQVVVCFLGTNDHSTEPSPETDTFIRGYRALLAKAREGRGLVPILCLYPTDRSNLEKRVLEAVAQEQAAGLPTLVLGLPPAPMDELGCDWHPMVVVHDRWAAIVEPKLREMMKWSEK